MGRVWRTCVTVAMTLSLTMLASITLVASPASADGTNNALGYPFFNQVGYPGNDASGVMATCVTGKESNCEDEDGTYAFDWGYEDSCPSIDPSCMGNGQAIEYGGHEWGMGDPWGYALRNCTSFVAWQLAQLGANPLMYGNLKNGGDWYKNAPPPLVLLYRPTAMPLYSSPQRRTRLDMWRSFRPSMRTERSQLLSTTTTRTGLVIVALEPPLVWA